MIDVNQPEAAEFATLCRQAVRQHGGIEAAAVRDDYPRLRSSELQQFAGGIEGGWSA
jgi:hypothetical protein